MSIVEKKDASYSNRILQEAEGSQNDALYQRMRNLFRLHKQYLTI